MRSCNDRNETITNRYEFGCEMNKCFCDVGKKLRTNHLVLVNVLQGVMFLQVVMFLHGVIYTVSSCRR